MITRRNAILAGLGLGFSAASLSAKEFWNEKKASEWTEDEVQQILTKSPWARPASIFDSSAHKGAPSAASRGGGSSRRSGGRTSGRGGQLPSGGVSKGWQATVRWQSALPVRDALKAPQADAEENYIIALVGDIPGAGIPTDDDSQEERDQKLEFLRDKTMIERKGDPIGLQRVKVAAATPQEPVGTLFYFARVFPLTLDDKQVTFVTKLGPLEVKCKFLLHDMLYRGALEL